jgi:hypothetical protein
MIPLVPRMTDPPSRWIGVFVDRPNGRQIIDPRVRIYY